jgi:uncharacterized protein (TIGR03083 family)
MTPDPFLLALDQEVDAFFDAIAACDIAAPVPACPDWDVGDLVYHLGEVHHFWGSVVEGGYTEPPWEHGLKQAERPPAELLVSWARESADRLRRILGAADPDTEVWTWAPQHDVAFVRRRMAQETAVHRWDAQASGAGPLPIDPWLAADGVDEWAAFFVSGDPGPAVALVASDAGDAVVVGVGDPVAKVTAPASDLLLALWNRVPIERLTITGDQAAIDALLSRAEME